MFRIFVTASFLFLLTSFAFGQSGKKLSQSNKIKSLSSWQIITDDDQFFSLQEDEIGKKKSYFVSFGRGQRLNLIKIVEKKQWENWRAILTQVMLDFPSQKSCPHPYSFKQIKNEKIKKEKLICLDEITTTERKKIQDLLEELRKYLDGK